MNWFSNWDIQQFYGSGKREKEADRFLGTGEKGPLLSYDGNQVYGDESDFFSQSRNTGRGCVDSSQCAAGFTCRGGLCYEPSGLIGGGSGYQDLGCGQSSDGTSDNCAPTTVSNQNTCDKTGCGENLNQRSAGQDDCCSEERCCRFSSTGYGDYADIRCHCGPCPEDENKNCNRYCDTALKAFGELPDSCNDFNVCDECEECSVSARKCQKLTISVPCHCVGACPQCHRCNNGYCYRDATYNCPDDKPEPAEEPENPNCDGSVVDTTTQSSSCESPRVQLGVITVGGETLYICGQRDYTNIPDACCTIQCHCNEQCPSGQCNNGACIPVADPNASVTEAASSSGGFIAVPGSDPVFMQSYKSPNHTNTVEAPSGGVIITQGGGLIIIEAADSNETFDAPEEFSGGVIVSGGNTIQISGATGSDPTPDYPTSSGGFIATVNPFEKVTIQPTLNPKPATSPVRATTDVVAADGSVISS